MCGYILEEFVPKTLNPKPCTLRASAHSQVQVQGLKALRRHNLVRQA